MVNASDQMVRKKRAGPVLMPDQPDREPPDVGIVCDFLFEGGAETVIDTFCAAYPKGQLYTSIQLLDDVHRYPAIQQATIEGRVHKSWAQALVSVPLILKLLSVYHFYWLYFLASATQHTRKHDLVLYSCAAQSKLIRAPRGTPVVVYFHTPTRWLYPGLTTPADVQSIHPVLRGLMRILNIFMRPLDQLGIRRLKKMPATWLANSSYTRDRVKQFYGIDCKVVYPPVDVARFKGLRRRPGDFFLYNGRLTFQKRVDLAIKASLAARKRLVISGKATSPAIQLYLERIVSDAVSQDPTLEGLVSFLGRTTDQQLAELLETCSALVFPPREDFGIAPIEAIAAGVPVIAFAEGGALDYIQDSVNGRFFHQQTTAALRDVLATFDPANFDATTVSHSLPDLSVARFQREIDAIVKAQL